MIPRRSFIRAHARYFATGLIALVFYSYAWLVQPDRPELTAVFDDPAPMVTVRDSGVSPAFAATPQYQYQEKRYGWLGAWYDQFHYARMARALGHGRLPGLDWDHERMVPEEDAPAGQEASSFSYGLGYPVVGAVFYVVGFRGDPFVVPDGLLFVLSAVLALALAERVLRPMMATIVVNALVLTGPFVLYFVIPYSNGLTTVAVLLGLLVATGNRFDWKIGAAFAVATSFAFAARYTDLVWILALAGVPLAIRWRQTWRVLACVGIGVAVTGTVVLLAHNAVFGSPFKTPYHYVHDGLDASWDAYKIRRIPDTAVGVFLTGDRSQLFRVEPILKQFPWAVFAVPGLVLLLRRRDRFRLQFAIGAAVGILSSLSYLAWFFGGTNSLKFWIIRFHAPFFPLWAILAGVFFEHVLARLGDDRAPAGPAAERERVDTGVGRAELETAVT